MAILRALLITAGLILGLVGALTAYVVPLSLPDAQLLGLTLNAPAGNAAAPGEKPRPILAKDDTLDAADIERLRAAGVTRVKVKEFSFSRWTGVWMFAGGAALLGLAALVGTSSRRSAPLAAPGGVPGSAPEQLLARLRQDVADLRKALGTTPRTDARLALMRGRIDAMMQQEIAGIIAARAALTARMGLAGYAQFVEPFAAAERSLNRAWSAAADDHEPEAMRSLASAEEHLAAAAARMS